MVSIPKPLAAERKLANYKRKWKLKVWRKHTRGRVWQRSGGICEIQKKCKES